MSGEMEIYGYVQLISPRDPTTLLLSMNGQDVMLSSLISAPRMLERSVICNGTLAEWLVRLDS